ncbi:16S rRNA (guanine(527)-N(7))-methyltransferase [hydrothermal vent metagenome]|uniref:16S rRNA (Guanine(527)-N(7))-methyltransferase n=1 Tax=hydrothermal vent metagenome TaxID=652676 RepID=A0A3B1DIK6_9ZZZZ
MSDTLQYPTLRKLSGGVQNSLMEGPVKHTMTQSTDPTKPTEDFLQAATTLGIVFEPTDLDQLARFLALLLDANTRTNLTAITDPAEAWTRHILDALTLLPMLADLPDAARIIDIGSGGGLPAIPLTIVCPHLRFTLLEATGKKVTFLRETIAALGLSNAEVIQGRAEQAGQDRGTRNPDGSRTDGLRESFDVVTARAVGRLAVVAELTIPLAKPTGLVLLIKGQKADEELAEAAKALEILGASHAGTVETPTGRIVALEKNCLTPRTYPRRDGEPKRVPLGVPKKA